MSTNIFSSLFKLSAWVFLSAGLILYNKYILSQMGFPFPVSLTLWHQLFCTCVVWIMRALSMPDAKSASISTEDYLKRVVPVGVIFAAVLWFGNAAYLYLSVSFIQMTKAFMPALVYFVGMCFGQQTLSLPKTLNLIIVVIGTLIASYGEVAFVLEGFVFLLASLVLEAVRICLLQILLQKPELKLNPIQTMMYVSPITAAALSAVTFFIEGPQVLKARTAFTGVKLGAIFLTNAVCAFALNFVMFKVIKDLDGLTVNVAGVVKDCLLIASSYVLFHSPVTWIQILGYAIALGAVFKYNLDKLGIKTRYNFFDDCLLLPKNVFGTRYMLIIIACVGFGVLALSCQNECSLCWPAAVQTAPLLPPSSSVGQTFEVVISAADEDLSWLVHFNQTFLTHLTVYTKGTTLLPLAMRINVVRLENIGRESETLMYHIVTNYRALKDVLVFFQANPFNHMKSRSREHVIAASNLQHEIDELLKSRQDEIIPLFADWYIEPPETYEYLEIRKYYELMFAQPTPDPLEFSAGCQYIIPRRVVHDRPLEFLLRIHGMLRANGNPKESERLPFNKTKLNAWQFERLPRYIFDKTIAINPSFLS